MNKTEIVLIKYNPPYFLRKFFLKSWLIGIGVFNLRRFKVNANSIGLSNMGVADNNTIGVSFTFFRNLLRYL